MIRIPEYLERRRAAGASIDGDGAGHTRAERAPAAARRRRPTE